MNKKIVIKLELTTEQLAVLLGALRYEMLFSKSYDYVVEILKQIDEQLKDEKSKED